MSRARVFLTGGTGFIGKWLIATLLDADRRLGLGCELVVLSRNPGNFAAEAPLLARAVRLEQGDVRDFVFPEGRFTHVIHAATDIVAQHSPLDMFSTCVDGTGRVLDFAAQSGASEFLLVSSGAVYGRQPPEVERLREDHAGAPDPLSPASAYGEGKRVAEWLTVANSAKGFHAKIARCFSFVGPYLSLGERFAIGSFLRDAMTNKEITIQGDGTPCRSYLYGADMAAWLWRVLLQGRANRAYNIGGDEAISIAELARRVIAVLGSCSTIRVMTPVTPGRQPERYVPDVGRALRELALPPSISLDEAILRTARWHTGNLAS